MPAFAELSSSELQPSTDNVRLSSAEVRSSSDNEQISSGAAFAETEIQLDLNLIQSGRYQPEESAVPESQTFTLDAQTSTLESQAFSPYISESQEAALRARMQYGFLNCQESIDILSLGIVSNQDTIDAVSAIMSDVINTTPSLFYVSQGGSITTVTYYDSSGDISTFMSKINSPYSYNPSSIASMKVAYEMAMQDLLSWVPANATPLEAAKAVHDWLVRYCTYNDAAAAARAQNYGDMSPWSSYGALVKKTPVCEGFSLAFLDAMNRLGIPCTIVAQWIGNDGHSWNRIELDGSWYNLDVTWDDGYTDPTFSATPDTTYFLKSDNWFKTQKTIDGFHTSWQPAGITGANTKYDYQVSWPTFSGKAASSSIAVTDFALSSTEMKLVADKSPRLEITGIQPTSVDSDVTRARAKWTSSDSEVATVDANGAVMAGSKRGTATITCTIGNVSRLCIVTVDGTGLPSVQDGTVSNVSNLTYDGAEKTQPQATLKVNGVPLQQDVDYTLSYKNNKNAGTASMTFEGINGYAGSKTVKFKIKKAVQPVSIDYWYSWNVSANDLKAKAKKLAAFKVREAKGKVTFVKDKGSSSCLKVAKKTGRITVAKGTKPGAYQANIVAKAAATKNYQAYSHKVTIGVTVN